MKDLIKTFIGKILNNRSVNDAYPKFIKDEYWTIAEAVDFTLLMNIKNIAPETFAEFRQRYMDKFNDALGHELYFVSRKSKYDVARDSYFIKEFLGCPHLNGVINDAVIDIIKVACRIDGKIKQKCLEKLDVFEFIACKNLIDDCDLKKTGLRIHSMANRKTKITIERPENAPLTPKEKGQRKYHEIHEFSDDVIKPLAQKELDTGCLCLHCKIVERITSKVKEKADLQLKGNANRNFMEKPDYHINKAVKNLFYGLGDKYDNVKSRVVRGKHYDKEYCKRQPPPKLCEIHKPKK